MELLSAASGTSLLLATPVDAPPDGAAGVGFKGIYEGQSSTMLGFLGTCSAQMPMKY
jgi:hypothetical protein